MIDSILNSSVIQGQYVLVHCIVLEGVIDLIMIDSSLMSILAITFGSDSLNKVLSTSLLSKY